MHGALLSLVVVCLSTAIALVLGACKPPDNTENALYWRNCDSESSDLDL